MTKTNQNTPVTLVGIKSCTWRKAISYIVIAYA